tara:strand:+ start:333 stop:1601 length:1269 start_codon:yes stop_codon:yes gene_type:complete
MRKEKIFLDQKAQEVLEGNDKGGYTIPTAGLYPYQWNWDSAFAAWGFSVFNTKRAWREIETLFAGQWPNGMLPHILFRQDDPDYFPGPTVWGTEGIGPISSSGISQPPVAATFIRAIWQRDQQIGTDHLLSLLPKIEAWHKWFMNWRISPEGAVFVTHPWEAGRDNSADWDSAMAMIIPKGIGKYKRRDTSHVDPSMRPTKADYDRYLWLVQRGNRLRWDEARMVEEQPFAVADPTLTFILLRANKDLAFMKKSLGLPTEEIDRWSRTLEIGCESLRHPESKHFNAVNLKSGEHTGYLTSASFLCWYAGINDSNMLDILKRTLIDNLYPVPSLDSRSNKFDGLRYWRGPTWPVLNALIGLGLSDMGYKKEAEILRSKTRDLISQNGFAEYFHPKTGAPGGGEAFSWTAAVWLAWASPSVGEK